MDWKLKQVVEELGLIGAIPALLAFLSKELLVGLLAVILIVIYIALILWQGLVFFGV